jgi:hypothetical protein
MRAGSASRCAEAARAPAIARVPGEPAREPGTPRLSRVRSVPASAPTSRRPRGGAVVPGPAG